MNPPKNDDTLNQIARDLDQCDLLNAFGSKSQKAKARRHRAKCFKHIHELNLQDGLNELSDDELLRELSS